MKQNYPTGNQIQASGDRVAALLRRAAQPVEPDFGAQYRGIMNASVAKVRGGRPLEAYNATIEGDEKKKRQASMDAVKAEASIYDLLLEQKKQGNADAEEILNVASKLSGNDSAQMSRLITEAYNRYPDGDITLTDAVNLAGELGIKPVKTDEQKLKEDYYRAQIARAGRTSGGDDGLTEYQRRQLELREQEIANRKSKTDMGKALPSNVVNDLMGKIGTKEGYDRLLSGFNSNYAGQPLGVGKLRNLQGRTFGDSGQAQWWQDYYMQQNKVRNELFGSALSAGEQAAWAQATANEGMAPSQVNANIERQRDIVTKALERLADTYRAGGYNNTQIDKLLGRTPSKEAPATREPIKESSGSIEDTLAADASLAERAAAMPSELPEEQVPTGNSVASANKLGSIKGKYGLE